MSARGPTCELVRCFRACYAGFIWAFDYCMDIALRRVVLRDMEFVVVGNEAQYVIVLLLLGHRSSMLHLDT